MGAMHRLKLFIPGPTEVRSDVLQAMAQPPIGHRTEEARELILEVSDLLRQLLQTKQVVLLSTSSATGLMEGAIRNLVARRVLCTSCGAFGKRWYEIALANGKEAELLAFPEGKPVDPDAVRKRLANGGYEAVTLVHNETSTGVLNPLEEIAEVVRQHPGVLLLVDAVTSMGAVPIAFDRLGLDLCLASVQKALALPPGFAVCAISERALNRAASVKDRGYYFDFVEMARRAAEGQTPITPSLPHLFGLRVQLRRILDEGMEERYRRHLRMARLVQDWARNRLALFADPTALSPTVTAVDSRGRLAPRELIDHARRHGFLIASGYGSLKEHTFRIAHMGELTEDDIRELLACLDDYLQRRS
ncbi:MAG: alanine--glyoxylate aminotransferase family protein [candidate division KSB1 bacterium]|nr:alanine--glyoxylate aminotransferase family protein [candidate division KSB1 bacterium]